MRNEKEREGCAPSIDPHRAKTNEEEMAGLSVPEPPRSPGSGCGLWLRRSNREPKDWVGVFISAGMRQITNQPGLETFARKTPISELGLRIFSHALRHVFIPFMGRHPAQMADEGCA